MNYENKTKEELIEEIRNLQKTNQLLEAKSLKDKYHKLFSELRVIIYESTPDGKLIDINPFGVKQLGYNSIDEILNSDIEQSFYYDSNDRKEFKEKIERLGFVKNLEIRLKNKKGELLFFSETGARLEDVGNKKTTYGGILQDITDRKGHEKTLEEYIEKLAVLNQKLIKSEEELTKLNAAKDKFFSIIAHDLRSPFTSLISLSDFLIEDYDEMCNDEKKNFIHKINKGSKDIFNLLENLLQWARIQIDKVEFNRVNFDMFDLIERTISVYEGSKVKKNIDLINEIKQNTCVYADKEMITSVVGNLISNAIKFTKIGGEINIFAQEEEGKIIISVCDNGVGIREKDIEKLFRIDNHLSTPGTAKERGSGLGLILCKELVEKNEGKIWVESLVDEGSVFSFTLQRAK